jgi:sensor domain CHASE-containing protein
MNGTLISVMVAALALGGCREKQAANSEKAPGMARMNMRADSLMPAMHAHLDSLAMVPADRLPGLISAHEIMTSQLLDAMGGDMTAMGMKGDSAWTALRDSVQHDLADLPALRGAQLEGRVRAHIDRLKRLLAMHGIMMGAMPKS